MSADLSYRGFVFEKNKDESDLGFGGFRIYKAGNLRDPWTHRETVEECQEICDSEIEKNLPWTLHAYRDILEKAFYAGGEACRGDGYNGERFDDFFKEITK